MKIRLSAKQPSADKFIDGIVDRYHFGPTDRDTLVKIYDKLRDVIAPMAAYRINQRVTGVKLIDDNPAAVVVLTLGDGPDELKERYTRGGRLDEAYMLDCITNELLMHLYEEFNETYARYHRRYVKRYVFIGDEISTERIPGLLTEIYGEGETETDGLNPGLDSDNYKTSENKTDSQKAFAEEIGSMEDNKVAARKRDIVCANGYGVMTPTKSVVFYAILTENPDQICEGICENCNNKSCENNPDYIEDESA